MKRGEKSVGRCESGSAEIRIEEENLKAFLDSRTIDQDEYNQ